MSVSASPTTNVSFYCVNQLRLQHVATIYFTQVFILKLQSYKARGCDQWSFEQLHEQCSSSIEHLAKITNPPCHVLLLKLEMFILMYKVLINVFIPSTYNSRSYASSFSGGLQQNRF